MNWWLMALSFLLGLGLTWLWTVRKVTRQMHVARTLPVANSAEASSAKASPVAAAAPAAAAAAPAAKGASAKDASAKGAPAAKAAPATSEPYAPYGSGSALPAEDGSAPLGWLVKGLTGSKVFYTRDELAFSQIRADVWFKDVKHAEKAGFTRAGQLTKDAPTR